MVRDIKAIRDNNMGEVAESQIIQTNYSSVRTSTFTDHEVESHGMF